MLFDRIVDRRLDRCRDINRTGCDSDTGVLASFSDGITPDAAVDEIEVMEEGDRGIYRVVIAADGEFDVFSVCCFICHSVGFPLVGMGRMPKN